MHDRAPKVTTQSNTVFGEFYVREQHSDAADQYLSSRDVASVMNSLKASLFEEVMRSLRYALGVRRRR